MNRTAKAWIIAAQLGLAISATPPQIADARVGSWKLNLERTHYGGGADPRRRETFVCEHTANGVACRINSVRSDGRALTATFAAPYDGRTHSVSGMPDVDQVSLRRVNDSIVDATFSNRGKPVFAYRAIRADSGRSLIIVAVDPITRAVLESVVFYDRQ